VGGKVTETAVGACTGCGGVTIAGGWGSPIMSEAPYTGVGAGAWESPVMSGAPYIGVGAYGEDQDGFIPPKAPAVAVGS